MIPRPVMGAAGSFGIKETGVRNLGSSRYRLFDYMIAYVVISW